MSYFPLQGLRRLSHHRENLDVELVRKDALFCSQEINTNCYFFQVDSFSTRLVSKSMIADRPWGHVFNLDSLAKKPALT